MRSRKSALRTVDVARQSGYSVQQIRNLEREGVLPPTDRTPAGYRVYTEEHVRAALAYRAFAVGAGPASARRIVSAAHRSAPSELLALVDDAHARLHAERQALALAREAAAAIAAEPIDDPRPADALSVRQLADALGVRPSTLRHWDAEGLVTPDRVGAHRVRVYSPHCVSEARIVHQLRAAGYRIGPLRDMMPLLRGGRRWVEVAAALAARDAGIDTRSRALLRGAAALTALADARRFGLDGGRPPAGPADGALTCTDPAPACDADHGVG